MVSRRALAGSVLLLALPGVAGAQLGFGGQPGRPNPRAAAQGKPAQSAKIDDAQRKLASEDADERLDGVRDLGTIDDPKVADALLQAANDTDGRVRLKAIDTLGNAKVKEATPFLVQRLFLRDTDLVSTQHILAALGKIGDPRATKPVMDYLSRNVDPAVRGNAIFALGEIGDPEALGELRGIAQKSPDDKLRSLARQAVQRIEERPAPEVVPPALAGDRRLGPPAATP